MCVSLTISPQAMFGSYVESGTVLNNYAHIFDLLIRLRQAVCHPYLVVHSATAPPESAAEEGRVDGEGGEGSSLGGKSDSKRSGGGGRKASAEAAAVEAPVCGLW